ncbi:MAG: transposase [Acidobacteriota bacterium]
MYDYRKMTLAQRAEIVERRRRRHQPLHSPPHWDLGISNIYFVSAACFDHARIIGKDPARMSQCEEHVLLACREAGTTIHAWCVLPNHYHLLVQSDDLKLFTKVLGQSHGRSSHAWNLEDATHGRKVWHRCFDRAIRSDRHFWATVNYIHHNPVHHGYVDKWQDWLWSSASEFLERVGANEATRIWREYPILDYGKKWDI